MRHIFLLLILYCAVECRRTLSESDNEKTIYLYTIGQPRFVKHAIAFTLLNRYKANRPEFGGHSIRDICLQFSENAQPEEFYIPEHKQIEMNKWLTKIWNDKSMYDPSKGALYFRFPDENVVWIEGMVKTTEINKIEFYKDQEKNE